MLLDLLQKIFEQEKMPEEWRDSVIIPIFKQKGDIQDCENYRGIKMISRTMKIWEIIIDRRLREETSVGEEQFGFMLGRGTTDAIFAARQVMEKHREMQKELHMVFIDLEKAYDRVPVNLQEILQGCCRIQQRRVTYSQSKVDNVLRSIEGSPCRWNFTLRKLLLVTVVGVLHHCLPLAFVIRAISQSSSWMASSITVSPWPSRLGPSPSRHCGWL